MRNDAGVASLQRLAAATAQRPAVARLGLRWLAARGHVRIEVEEGDAVRLHAGSGVAGLELPAVTAELREALAETAAFRRYFSQAEAETLFS